MDRRTFLRLGGMTATGLCLGLAPFVPFSPLVTEAMARGSSREEAERAKSIVDALQARGMNSENKTMGPGAACTLQPGGMLKFEVHGFCLDSNFSAPSANEPLAFRPASNYIAPDLRELYTRVMRNALTSRGKSADIQKMVWAMRAPAGSEWTRGFDANDRAYLESAQAGGLRLLQTAPRSAPHVAGGHSRGGGGGGGGGPSGADILGFLLPAIAGSLPYDIRTHSSGLMRQLQNRRAERAMPDNIFRYSMLRDDGVAGLGFARQGLTVHGTVANGSPEPFTFDPIRWVMESSRDVQAVALPSLQSMLVGKGQPLPQDDAKQPDRKDAPKDQKSQQQDGGDFHEFATEPQG